MDKNKLNQKLGFQINNWTPSLYPDKRKIKGNKRKSKKMKRT